MGVSWGRITKRRRGSETSVATASSLTGAQASIRLSDGRYGDDGFDDGRISRALGETPRGVGEVEAVGDPGRDVDAAGLEERNDVAEGAGQGVAAGEERQFAAVGGRVVESDLALGQADENNAAARRGQVGGAGHGLGGA